MLCVDLHQWWDLSRKHLGNEMYWGWPKWPGVSIFIGAWTERIQTLYLEDVVASSWLEHSADWVTAEDTLWWIPSNCNSRNFRMWCVDGRAPGCKKHDCISCQCASRIGLWVGLCCVCPSATLMMIVFQCLTSAQGSFPERTYDNKMLLLTFQIVTRRLKSYFKRETAKWIDIASNVWLDRCLRVPWHQKLGSAVANCSWLSTKLLEVW